MKLLRSVLAIVVAALTANPPSTFSPAVDLTGVTVGAGAKTVRVVEFLEKQQELVSFARRTILETGSKIIHNFNRRQVDREFVVGDKVLLSADFMVTDHSVAKKFGQRWIGPFDIVPTQSPQAGYPGLSQAYPVVRRRPLLSNVCPSSPLPRSPPCGRVRGQQQRHALRPASRATTTTITTTTTTTTRTHARAQRLELGAGARGKRKCGAPPT